MRAACRLPGVQSASALSVAHEPQNASGAFLRVSERFPRCARFVSEKNLPEQPARKRVLLIRRPPRSNSMAITRGTPIIEHFTAIRRRGAAENRAFPQFKIPRGPRSLLRENICTYPRVFNPSVKKYGWLNKIHLRRDPKIQPAGKFNLRARAFYSTGRARSRVFFFPLRKH